jgi:hypothetical protein
MTPAGRSPELSKNIQNVLHLYLLRTIPRSGMNYGDASTAGKKLKHPWLPSDPSSSEDWASINSATISRQPLIEQCPFTRY